MNLPNCLAQTSSLDRHTHEQQSGRSSPNSNSPGGQQLPVMNKSQRLLAVCRLSFQRANGNHRIKIKVEGLGRKIKNVVF